jgi:hypothetical protein
MNDANYRQTSHAFTKLKSFDEAMRGIVAVPKEAIERREKAWKAARKKKSRSK